MPACPRPGARDPGADRAGGAGPHPGRDDGDAGPAPARRAAGGRGPRRAASAGRAAGGCHRPSWPRRACRSSRRTCLTGTLIAWPCDLAARYPRRGQDTRRAGYPAHVTRTGAAVTIERPSQLPPGHSPSPRPPAASQDYPDQHYLKPLRSWRALS